MKNYTTNFSKMGIVLLLIGVFGVVNAIGDIAFFSFFAQFFANKQLFFIAGTLTLICNILFLVFLFGRKLFLFQMFFFASCIIALIHLSLNLFALYPLTIFDILFNANTIPLINDILIPMLGLLRTIYPAFLVIGILASLGVLIVCFLYFKRSKRIAEYFDS
ncbi:MAG: hypothetical protein Ta2G_06100 [Termitinemataceae bacterium]|nr:MAG: hypothetical protein Ta2G_06100 [Termitinemataceae bacterium]